jgi:hypothetical protein
MYLLDFIKIKVFIEIQICSDTFASDFPVKISTLLADEI